MIRWFWSRVASQLDKQNNCPDEAFSTGTMKLPLWSHYNDFWTKCVKEIATFQQLFHRVLEWRNFAVTKQNFVATSREFVFLVELKKHPYNLIELYTVTKKKSCYVKLSLLRDWRTLD